MDDSNCTMVFGKHFYAALYHLGGTINIRCLVVFHWFAEEINIQRIQYLYLEKSELSNSDLNSDRQNGPFQPY